MSRETRTLEGANGVAAISLRSDGRYLVSVTAKVVYVASESFENEDAALNYAKIAVSDDPFGVLAPNSLSIERTEVPRA